MKTFRQLLSENNYKYVFNKIHSIYLKGKTLDQKQNFDLKFYSAWKELQELKGINNKDENLYLAEIGEEEDLIVDVCLFNKKEDKLFALDFVDWGDIIDMEVYKATNFSDEECLAHILWEITFWGFTNKKVKEEKLKTLNESL